MLVTEDENGEDVKIVAAPGKQVDPYYADIEDLTQVPGFTRNQIEHFFSKYKELEPSKFVKVIGWETKEEAKKKISEAIARYKSISKSK